MLFAYACADFYVKPEGRLAFLITQTVFQSKEAGAGFRSFHVRNGRNLNVTLVEDLAAIQPFPFAANRTSMFVSVVGAAKTRYPVPYNVWQTRSKKSRQIPEDLSLGEISHDWIKIEPRQAEAVDGGTGPWMILPKGTKKATLDKLRTGSSPYRALKGSDTRGANSVFWLRPIKNLGKKILVENTPEFARKKVKKVPRALEKHLVYPLLRGKDVGKWSVRPELFILFPHEDDNAIPEADIKKLPETWSYLNDFREFLEARKMYDLGFRKLAFYSLFETGKFLTADWKVVFREQSASLTTAVVGPYSSGEFLGEKPVIPDHKLMVAAMEGKDDAHYVCALLNSSLSRFFAEAYFIETSISTHILDYIKIPKFSSKTDLHRRLSRASQRAHELTVQGDEKKLVQVEREIDVLAAELWGITSKELEQIQKALEKE